MVLIDTSFTPQACWEFEADIFVITHSTTISVNYEAVIHCGCIRQVAKLQKLLSVSEGPSIEKFRNHRRQTNRHQNAPPGDVLRSGSKGTALFRFKYHPVYLTSGARLIFREGRTKGIGRVSRVIPYQPTSDKVR